MKKYRKRICACMALIITTAVIIGTVWKDAKITYAHETFSGVSQLVSDKVQSNSEFLILELVDNPDEASIGYLVEGQEPYANSLSGMSVQEQQELIRELQEKGLLAIDDAAEQSAYPLSFEENYEYSTDPEDSELLSQGFLPEEDSETGTLKREKVKGYFIAQETGKQGYYRLLNTDIESTTLTYTELLEKLLDSYTGELFTTDNEYTAYCFEADDNAEAPDIIEKYEVTVHLFGEIVGDDGTVSYGYDSSAEEDNALLEVLTTDENGCIVLPNAEDFVLDDGSKYIFLYYALGNANGYYDVEAENGGKVTSDHVYQADTDIWAVYAEIQSGEYQITVHYVEAVYNGGVVTGYTDINGDEKVLVTSRQRVTLPAEPSYPDYTFTNRYLLSDWSTEVTFDTTFTQDTDVYALYTKNAETHTVTVYYPSPIYGDGDTISGFEYNNSTQTITTDADGKITLPAVGQITSFDGYTFLGFSKSSTDTQNILTGNEVYTEDTNIYAVYEKNNDGTEGGSDGEDGSGEDSGSGESGGNNDSGENGGSDGNNDSGENGGSNVAGTSGESGTQTQIPGENEGSDGNSSTSSGDAANAAVISSEDDTAGNGGSGSAEGSQAVTNMPAAETPASSAENNQNFTDGASIQIDTEHGELLAMNGGGLPISFMTVMPVDDALPSDMTRIAGYGYRFTYAKMTLSNNNLFKTQVLGLEEGTSEFNQLKIRVITYTVDGLTSSWTNNAGLSLGEAIEKADLVYMSAKGKGADLNDISVINLRLLFGRAAEDKLPVILNYSAFTEGNTDKNLWKLAYLLLQPDLSAACGAINWNDFEGNDWAGFQQSVELLNSGNFVRDNIFCVNYSREAFKNSSYAQDDSALTSGRVPVLANADFGRQYTDSVSDGGFAKVYTAIQQENYERGQNDSGKSSMNEYVTPAVAVAYILNFEGYDPIIYKDSIRVLELEPCRDYTYYYDGDTSTEEGAAEQQKRKLQFATEWAPAFEERLDAITIDGMTTSEFCGKINDVYEDYDVIYFGSNTGIMNTITAGAGITWEEATAIYSGTASIDGSSAKWKYENGTWYSRVLQDSEIIADGYGADISISFWNTSTSSNEEWKWSASDHKWYQVEWVQDESWNWVQKYTEGTYPNTYTVQSYESVDSRKWEYRNGKWYRYYPDGTTAVWSGWEEDSFGPYTTWTNEEAGWRWNGDSHKWETAKHNAGTTFTVYNDEDMTGIVYAHTGDVYYPNSGYNGLLACDNESSVGYRFSGNDILDDQVDQLLDFLKSGSPIILASDFVTTDADGKTIANSSAYTTSVWYDTGYRNYTIHGILDNSSYVYQFVNEACNAGYSNLLIQGNATAANMAAALNQQKLTLNMLSVPTEYTYVETNDELGAIVDCTYLSKESDGNYYLNYQFTITNLSAVTPLSTRYHIQLFLDSNSDGIYNTETEELTDIVVTNAQTGETVEMVAGSLDGTDHITAHYELQANTPYTVRRELPEGYVGCIGWKLKATQVGNSYIHDSVTGLTAVPNEGQNWAQIDPVTGKQVIHVLQILSGDGTRAITLDLEKEVTDDPDGEWAQLLASIPDFVVEFDSIYEFDFAYSFESINDPVTYAAYVDPRNVNGKEGYLTGKFQYDYDTSHPVNSYSRRNDYLNFYEYDMVIVGFADEYRNLPSERATEAILAYGNSGKSLMYTHDTTFSAFVLSEPYASDFTIADDHTGTFSMSIREQAGMDRYGVTVDRYEDSYAYNIIKDGIEQAAEAVEAYNNSHDREGSDIAYLPGAGQSLMAPQTQGLTYSSVGVQNGLTAPYYGYLNNPNLANWKKDTTENNNRITQVNSGIITQYPYTIGETIVVSNTHAQYFQLDLDTDSDGDGRGDVVVWYCISSLDSELQSDNWDWNDAYDCSPNDVRNNYYIYNKGNITYTGVGHTGNFTIDEMKLFINTFVAAYHAGLRNPSVRIVDGMSVNAPDLEHVSIPYVDGDENAVYRVYYQVKDNNITTGTKALSIRYYIGNADGTDLVRYDTQEIPASLFADGELTTYHAVTGMEVPFNQVVSGNTYYVDIPLSALDGPAESFDFYVEVDLRLAGMDEIAAYAVDKLTILEIRLFDLD